MINKKLIQYLMIFGFVLIKIFSANLYAYSAQSGNSDFSRLTLDIKETQLGEVVEQSVFAANLTGELIKNGFIVVDEKKVADIRKAEGYGTRSFEKESYYKQLFLLCNSDLVITGEVTTTFLDKFNNMMCCNALVILKVECCVTGETIASYTMSTANYNITEKLASYDAIVELTGYAVEELLSQIRQRRIVEISVSGASYQDARLFKENLKNHDIICSDPDYVPNFFVIYVNTHLSKQKLIDIIGKCKDMNFKVLRSFFKKLELSKEKDMTVSSQSQIDWGNYNIKTNIVATDKLNSEKDAEDKLKGEVYKVLLNILADISIDGDTTLGNIMLQNDYLAETISDYVKKQSKLNITIDTNTQTQEVTADLSLDKDNTFFSAIKEHTTNAKEAETYLSYNKESSYTGIIIDATGLNVKPVLHPVIFNHQREEIYGPSVVNSERIVAYEYSVEDAKHNPIVGDNPLILKAEELIKNLKGEGINIVLSSENAELFVKSLNKDIISKGAVIIVDLII